MRPIGQRESVATTGSVFTQASGAWTWGYGALGQVVSADSLPAAPNTNSTLTWDGDHNLLSATVGETTVTYTYDARGRRVIRTRSGQRTYWTYDGWNPVAEHTGAVHTSGSAPLVGQEFMYVWGPDITGTMQGAGGVGGLLLVRKVMTSDFGDFQTPTYDGNGNVSDYLNPGGGITAHYEYDPFGNILPASYETVSSHARHRFSTKPVDAETGLCYYGFRYYDPLAGRWLNRDPIGERGGVNLYGFVGNCFGLWDMLGLDADTYDVEGNWKKYLREVEREERHEKAKENRKIQDCEEAKQKLAENKGRIAELEKMERYARQQQEVAESDARSAFMESCVDVLVEAALLANGGSLFKSTSLFRTGQNAAGAFEGG